MATNSAGLSNSKSICILLVVLGCFSVLWPKIFYPMLMTGLNWHQNKFSFEHDGTEQILPPKVREAMRLSPRRESAKPKLPGRPQFYAGSPAQATQTTSVLNIAMPVYTILIAVFFLFTLFKLSRGNKDNNTVPTAGNPDQCQECNYDRSKLFSKRNNPYLSRSSYRAFSMYGHNAVNKNLYSLIRDMEIFRDQLVKAEICHCKLEKYEMAIKATENCLHGIKEEISKDENDDPETNDEVKVETTEEMTNENKDKNEVNQEEQSEEESIHEEQECNEESESRELEENIDDDKENIPLNLSKLKKRKTNKTKPEEFAEQNELDRLTKMFDEKTLRRLNKELDRLMHSKKD